MEAVVAIHLISELDIIGALPPWWDWILVVLSMTGLAYVGITSLVEYIGHRRGHTNNWRWFQKGLHPKVVAIATTLGLVLFWFAPERRSMNYLLTLLALALVSTVVSTRLTYQRRNNS